MITYLQTIKDTKTQRLDMETWQRLTESEQTRHYISKFRITGDISLKQRLPAVNFHGYDPKVLKGLFGSRKQADLVPTGLFMLDIDHIDNPTKVWEVFKKQMAKEGISLESNVALVHITPSGKGLRIVMKGREGSTIKEDQKWLAQLLCVQHDECTKDLSRWSFIPMKTDIIYHNYLLLFKDAEETSYNKTTETLSLAERPAKAKAQGGLPLSESVSDTAEESSEQAEQRFPTTFRGFPYARIVERLIQFKGGQPEVGERHGTIIYLANNLKTICDQNVDWLMEVIPSFDKPRNEKREAIIWAVQHRSADQSVALKKVLEELRNGDDWMDDLERESYLDEVEKRRKDALAEMPRFPDKLPTLIEHLTSNVMPFQKPAVAQLCMPALATHVAESKFLFKENKPIELSLMGVIVGAQSTGKGCVDEPIEAIIKSIKRDDQLAEDAWREWASHQNKKSANTAGKDKPTLPTRIFDTDTTPAALLESLYNAQNYGYAKDLCCFSFTPEIESLYSMSPVGGKSMITQLIRKTYDRARIGANRASSIAVKCNTIMRWNWTASTTPQVAKNFFKKALADGTLSRVDFSVLLPLEDDEDEFIYGNYDNLWHQKLEPYIENLKKFRCKRDEDGEYIPFRLERLIDLEEDMNLYIKEYSKRMPDNTWKSYAWRTKLNALKKILVLYIANNGVWEDCFTQFGWWCFHYNMWVKMNLFYEKASEVFDNDEIISSVCIKSPLDLVGDSFTRKELYDAIIKCGKKTPGAPLVRYYEKNGQIVRTSDRDHFKKISK